MNRLKVGDLVQVISGKDKGKQGKVTKIINDTNRVVVEGINTVTRNQKPTPRNQQGGQIKKDAPIHASERDADRSDDGEAHAGQGEARGW